MIIKTGKQSNEKRRIILTTENSCLCEVLKEEIWTKCLIINRRIEEFIFSFHFKFKIEVNLTHLNLLENYSSQQIRKISLKLKILVFSSNS